MKNHNIIHSLILACILSCAASAVIAQEPAGSLKDSLFPIPDSQITDTQPAIVMNFNNAGVEVRADTAVITIDGIDVSTDSDITGNYILYRPDGPLSAGKHTVSISAIRTDGSPFGLVKWSFMITGGEVADGPRPDNTAGRLKLTTDYVAADYTPLSGFELSRFLPQREGTKSGVDFSVTNVSEGRVIKAAYKRRTQPYTDVSIDTVSMTYHDEKFNAALGDFRLELSDFTVPGTNMKGVEIDRDYGPWSLKAFGGRTQDPGVDGDFRQMTYGLRGGYSWNNKHDSSLTMLRARENYDAYFRTLSEPAEDDILSFSHLFRYNDDFYAEGEAAINNRKEDGGAAAYHDSAYSFTIHGRIDDLRGSFRAYDAGEFFMPVSNGTSGSLNSNREGFRLDGAYEPLDWASAGGLYEEYYSYNTFPLYIAETKTKRGNAYVTFSIRDYLPALTYRKTKLVNTAGLVSESDNIHATLLIPPIATNFSRTRVSASWSDIRYSSRAADLGADVLMFSVYMSFRDSLSISLSYNLNENDDILRRYSTDYKRYGADIRWRMLPGRLAFTGSYSDSDTSGDSSDINEKQYGIGLEYIIDRTYSCSLGWERVLYSDAVNTYYDYDLDIIRTEMEMRF